MVTPPNRLGAGQPAPAGQDAKTTIASAIHRRGVSPSAYRSNPHPRMSRRPPRLRRRRRTDRQDPHQKDVCSPAHGGNVVFRPTARRISTHGAGVSAPLQTRRTHQARVDDQVVWNMDPAQPGDIASAPGSANRPASRFHAQIAWPATAAIPAPNRVSARPVAPVVPVTAGNGQESRTAAPWSRPPMAAVEKPSRIGVAAPVRHKRPAPSQISRAPVAYDEASRPSR